MESIPQALLDRFWSKVDKTSSSRGCWLWTAACFTTGYGCFEWQGKSRSAHRISYELANGSIPRGLWILHRCDTPACVNPDHLYAGTHRQNMVDMVEHGRAATGERNGKRLYPDKILRGDNHPARLHPEYLARGEKNGNSKMTAEKVRAMRALYDAGGILLRELAPQFDCPLGTVHQIVTRKTWRDIR